MFDFERKRFFKMRCSVLLTSVMRMQRKNERMIIYAAFHRIMNAAFYINKTFKPKRELPNASKSQALQKSSQSYKVKQELQRDYDKRARQQAAATRFSLYLISLDQSIEANARALKLAYLYRWRKNAEDLKFDEAMLQYSQIFDERIFHEQLFRQKYEIQQHKLEFKIVLIQDMMKALYNQSRN